LVTGCTRTVDSGTLTVNGSTLMVNGGSQMSDDHHRAGSATASTSRLRHHQAKQHPHVCSHKAKIRSCMLHVIELDSIKMIARVMLAWVSTSRRGQISLAAPSPRQRHRQDDSAEASCHGQRRLGSTIANMTRHRHHATTKSPR
jgi:hypothetical protein